MTVIEKIQTLTATLPEDARASVEARIVAQAEAAVHEYQEHMAQVANAREGLADLERGDVFTLDEVKQRDTALIAKLRAERTPA